MVTGQQRGWQPRRGSRRAPRWIVAALVAVSSLVVSAQLIAPHGAAGDTGGYPYASMPCAHPPFAIVGKCPNYDWGPVKVTAKNWSEETTHTTRGYGYRNCTDYVAWRLEGLGVPDKRVRGLGNGGQWSINAAGRPGVFVTNSAAFGDAAVVYGSPGHVAFVEAVNPDGTITVSEYDRDGYGEYQVQTGTIAQLGFNMFVNFGISPKGSSNPVFPPYDSTVVHPQGGTGLYVMAGGAPLYLSNWTAIGGAKPITTLNQTQWSLLNAVPSDGTVLAPHGGGLFVVAGGAPLYVSHWAAIGGVRPSIAIDSWDLANAGTQRAHLRAVPSDATVLVTSDAKEYVVAGGAPLRVADPTTVSASRPTVLVDSWAVSHAGVPDAHLFAVPENGTLLTSAAGGLYVVAGGAPLFVTARAAVGYTHHPVVVDTWDLSDAGGAGTHLNAVPANGTILGATTKSGAPAGSYIVGGGAPFRISNWSIYGGAIPGTQVDQWAVENAGTTLSHLWSTPAVGTVVAGLPSGTFYVFNGPRPTVTTKTAVPVVVNDDAIAAFDQATATVLSTSANPSPQAKPLTVFATVSPSSSTGAVTFYDGGTRVTSCSSVPLVAGKATCVASNPSRGVHVLSASYSGDGVNHPSMAKPYLETIGRPDPGLKVTEPAGTVVAGSSLTVRVTLASAATGAIHVIFASASCSTVALHGAGACVLKAPRGVTSATVVATYSGDLNFAPAAATAVVGVKSSGMRR